MNETNVRTRIKLFVDEKGIKQSEFFLKTGLSRGILDTDKLDKDIGADKVSKILNTFPEININWLLIGQGEMFGNPEERTIEIIKEIEVIKEVKVPSETIEIIKEIEVIKEVKVPSKTVEIIKEVEVIKEVKVPSEIVEIIKEVEVIKEVKVPSEIVEIIKEVEVIKEVKVPYTVEVIKEVPKIVEVIKEVEIIKEIEVVKEIEVIKEVKIPSEIKTKTKEGLPLYNVAASNNLYELLTSENIQPIAYLNIPKMPLADAAIHMVGDNMYPLLKSGDILVFKRIQDFKTNIFWGQLYVISLEMGGDEYLQICWIHKSDKGDDFVKLVNENKHYQTKEIAINKIKALAAVKVKVCFN